MKKPFPVERLKSALLAIADKLAEPQKQMIRTHYLYRVASMGTIAKFGNYDSYRSANLHYAAVGRKIADQIGYDCQHGPMETIATVCKENDKDGHAQWRMDDPMATALEAVGWTSPADAAPILNASQDVRETEREALVKARAGQGIFRSEVIALWGCCAVSGCGLPKILVASHIVPWKDATNVERLDPFNGLLLTPNLDRLFDQCLISFNDDGSILLSKNLSAEVKSALGVSDQCKLRFVRPAMLPYLQRHRRIYLEEEERPNCRNWNSNSSGE
jgi:hypothetical protein